MTLSTILKSNVGVVSVPTTEMGRVDRDDDGKERWAAATVLLFFSIAQRSSLVIVARTFQCEIDANGGFVAAFEQRVHIAFDDAGLARADITHHKRFVQVLLMHIVVVPGSLGHRGGGEKKRCESLS